MNFSYKGYRNKSISFLSLTILLTLFFNPPCATAQPSHLLESSQEKPSIRFEKILRLNAQDTYKSAQEILNSYTWEQWVERWPGGKKGSDKYETQKSIFSDFASGKGFNFIDPVWSGSIYVGKDFDELKECVYGGKSNSESKEYSFSLTQPFLGPIALYNFRQSDLPEDHPYKNLIAIVVYNEIVPQKSAELNNGQQLEIGASGFLSHVLYLVDITTCERKQRLPISSSHLGGYISNAAPNLIGVGIYGDKLATYNIRTTPSQNLFVELWLYDQNQRTDKNFGFDSFIPLRLHMPDYSIKKGGKI